MKKFLCFFLFIVCAGTAAFAQADLQIVASVRLTRPEPITVRQLRVEMETMAYQALLQSQRRPPTSAEVSRMVQNTTIPERRQALELMINERLMLQSAERARITVSDNELNQHIGMLRAQMAQAAGRQPTESEFVMAIRTQTGLEMPAFREQIRRQMIVQAYLMHRKGDQIRNVQQPTEAEIVNFYNLARTNFIRPEAIRFTMIAVPHGPDAASRNRARDTADRLNREIGGSPARFDDVVLRGQNPNSGFMAGDAGYAFRDLETQAVAGPDFMSVAFNLRQGEVSRVIQGNGAYQIIKITETHAQRSLELDDIHELGTRITVRQFIGGNMMMQRQQEAFVRASNELIQELRTGNPFQIFENNLNW